MIYSIDVRIEAQVNATEVSERVADAVQNVFPKAEIQETADGLLAETHTLDPFSEKLYEQEILDTARREFTNGRREDGFHFALKKQAALQGVINFAVGNPDELGDIEVDVTVREPSVEAFVDHVAPPTEDGVPIEPEDR